MRFLRDCVLGVFYCLFWLGASHADTFRLTAYNVTCFTSPEALEAHATIEAYVTLSIVTQRRRIDWHGSCRGPGPTTTPYPVVTVEDGAVHEITVAAWPALNSGRRLPLASSLCYHTAESGYADFRCLASDTYGGGVDILVSIAAVP